MMMGHIIFEVKQMMDKGKKVVSITILLLLLAGGGILFSKVAHKKAPVTANMDNVTSVKVEQAKTSENPVILSYKATIEPVDEGVVSSKIAGRVVRILFDDSQQVSQDEPLIQLDDQDLRDQLNTAEANLQNLNINLETAQRNYDRNKQLFEQGAIAKADFESVETALKTAKANLNSSLVNIDSLKHSLANAVIRAPISGIIDNKSVNLGQYVSPGTELAKVKNVSSVYATIQVGQSDVKYITAGQKAQVKLGQNDSTIYEGVVKMINVSADSSARVFNCKVQINNPNQDLHPGVFANVEVATDQKKNLIAIPVNDLTGSEGEYSVFVLENGVARKRSISIGRIIQNLAEVTSGLQEGEQVIVTNLNTLQDGDKVTVNGQGE